MILKITKVSIIRPLTEWWKIEWNDITTNIFKLFFLILLLFFFPSAGVDGVFLFAITVAVVVRISQRHCMNKKSLPLHFIYFSENIYQIWINHKIGLANKRKRILWRNPIIWFLVTSLPILSSFLFHFHLLL